MRLILGALAGAVIVFIASAVLHVATPFGMMGIGMIPNEDPVLQAIRANVPGSGLYMFPGFDPNAKATKQQEEAWMQKLRAGPYGLLVVQTQGSEPMEPRQLVMEFVVTFIAALVAALILSRIAGSYAVRVGVMALLVLFVFFSVSASHWIWYKYPMAFVGAEAIMELIAWVLAGLAMAKIIRPKVVAAA